MHRVSRTHKVWSICSFSPPQRPKGVWTSFGSVPRAYYMPVRAQPSVSRGERWPSMATEGNCSLNTLGYTCQVASCGSFVKRQSSIRNHTLNIVRAFSVFPNRPTPTFGLCFWTMTICFTRIQTWKRFGAEGSYCWTVTNVEMRLSTFPNNVWPWLYGSIYPGGSAKEEFENLDCMEYFDYCGCNPPSACFGFALVFWARHWRVMKTHR